MSVAPNVVRFEQPRRRPARHEGQPHGLSYARYLMRRQIMDSEQVKTATEVLVATTLVDYLGVDGRGAYPSVATVAAKTRLDPRTVRRVLTTLVARGVLVVTTPRTGGLTTTHYDLGDALRASLGEAATQDTGPGDPGSCVRPPRTQDPPIRGSDQRIEERTYAAPAAPTAAPPSDAARALLHDFARRWEDQHGRPYRPRRSDRRHAEQLAASRSPRQLQRLLDDYFSADADPYYVSRCHPLALLAAQADRVEQDESCRGSGPRVLDAEQSQRYLQALRQFPRATSGTLAAARTAEAGRRPRA